jgi:hypothetical protein
MLLLERIGFGDRRQLLAFSVVRETRVGQAAGPLSGLNRRRAWAVLFRKSVECCGDALMSLIQKFPRTLSVEKPLHHASPTLHHRSPRMG